MSTRPVSWDDQRAFLAVLDEGSYSAAARSLGLTQPTVRARIEALEAALGTTLFTRSVHGLAPTEPALALGASARAMAHASDAFVRTAMSDAAAPAGVVRLSVSEFIGIEVIPPMLATLADAHPDIRIELDLSNQGADLLGQEVDIAVRMFPPRQEALVAKKVATIECGLYAAPAYLARHGVPRSVADLRGHRMIGPDRSRADLAIAQARLPGIEARDFALRTDSHPAVLAAARAGAGIAVVQRPVGDTDPRLVAVLPALMVVAFDTWIVTHENLRRIARIRAVFDHLAAAFEAYAGGPGFDRKLRDGVDGPEA